LRTRKSIEVTKHGVQTVLKNPFYYGDFIWGGVRYNGSHETIIDKQLFDRVGAVFADKNVSRIRTKRIFAYKRILKCGYCGRAVTAERQKDMDRHVPSIGWAEMIRKIFEVAVDGCRRERRVFVREFL